MKSSAGHSGALAGPGRQSAVRVHRSVDVAAAYAWRLIVIAVAALGALWLIRELWVVFAALVVALFLTRALAAPARWMRMRVRPAPAAAIVLIGFLLVVAAVLTAVGAAVASEVGDLGPTVGTAVDDVTDWIVDDSPLDVSRADVRELRESFSDRIGGLARSSSGSIVSGALVVVEAALSLLLALVLTFFGLKDGDRLLAWVRRSVPGHREDVVVRMGARAWTTLGGYLRGAAMLGIVEGAIMAITLTVVGAELAVPVAVMTLLAAFVPFVGAIVAGALAVLVALATAGVLPAAIVLGVALVVQQLDNEVLAPLVYGRALDMHPVVVLLAITCGGALFGLPGSFLAVPVTAVVWNMVAESRPNPAAPDVAGGPDPLR